MAFLDTILFDPKKKSIVWRSNKILKVGTQPKVVTVNEKSIMQGTNEDPQLMESISVATAQANANNIDKLMENVDQYKEKMIKMKDTLVKERGEG